VKNEIRIVQASLLGSILANLLLILGMAFLLGGLRFQEQVSRLSIADHFRSLLTSYLGLQQYRDPNERLYAQSCGYESSASSKMPVQFFSTLSIFR